ncbi:hypothetical protein M231_07376 [Tremella mesenterica]|uniref:Uncharacterized protein n=1 Tax=Tremella mesenterica TaxID=5217 RepID=A0A4Q1BCD1_TREME|nr:uncharacterized protein TREMEDRAFT_60195 [Tremella mesenterica DSM 1558]EIW71264.1 hypothetical protein TREMEDRAFT_60195 [Tremella mesenterica DSM 1558]RXK35354.1 hypothetical protein M231_07376 [Tremella mesenterica]
MGPNLTKNESTNDPLDTNTDATTAGYCTLVVDFPRTEIHTTPLKNLIPRLTADLYSKGNPSTAVIDAAYRAQGTILSAKNFNVTQYQAAYSTQLAKSTHGGTLWSHQREALLDDVVKVGWQDFLVKRVTQAQATLQKEGMDQSVYVFFDAPEYDKTLLKAKSTWVGPYQRP